MWDRLFPHTPKEGLILQACIQAEGAKEYSRDEVCGPKIYTKY